MAMISRRQLIAAFSVGLSQMSLSAAQQKPRQQGLKTVTLVIDGMT
jgi:hypothetical protein